MNVLTRAYHRALVGLKQFRMRWSGSSSWTWGSYARERFDYAGAVGDGRSNSAVEAVIGCICRVFPEAPMQVVATKSNGDRAPVPAHPMTALVRRPNPYYSGLLLWQATLADWLTDGNAYWLKERAPAGNVLYLWWVSPTFIEPKYPDDGSRFLTHYEYRPTSTSTPIRIETKDVVHFRNGLDPRNPRKGRSPLASLMREIFTDDEAAAYTAALLRNMGGPGVVISIDDGGTSLSQEEADRIKADYEARFGGGNRGRVLVIGAKAKIDMPGFSPEQMNLKALRMLPESRIAAIYGAAAMVVGLEVGLEHSIYANYSEAREALYESNIIPTQRLFSAELDTQLLPDFGDPAREEVAFDNATVRVLQPDLDKLHTRLDVAVRGGWLMPNEAREKVGLDPLPGGDVVYVPIAVTPTDPAELVPPEPVDQPPPPPAGLGEPSPLRALPQPAKGGGRLPEAKAGHRSLADGLTRLRARHHAGLERDLARYLDQQQARVLAALEQAKGHPLAEAKALDWSAVFDLLGETRGLTSLLQKWYRRVLGGVHALTEDALGVSFDLDDPTTRAYLAEAGKQIGGITETTRAAIAAALQEGQAAGEGIPQLARRIQALTDFSRARAETISRTELGHAANTAALATYRASDVVHGVEIFDGDGCGLRSHDDPQKANGVKLRLDQMADVPSLAHPRCVRAFGAITDPSELEGVA